MPRSLPFIDRETGGLDTDQILAEVFPLTGLFNARSRERQVTVRRIPHSILAFRTYPREEPRPNVRWAVHLLGGRILAVI